MMHPHFLLQLYFFYVAFISIEHTMCFAILYLVYPHHIHTNTYICAHVEELYFFK